MPTASMTASGPRPPVSTLSCSTTSASSSKLMTSVAPALLRAICEPVVVLVDRDHLLGAEHHGAGDRELADRARPEDRDRLAAGDVAEVRAHEARRQDVREEQHLLVGQLVLELERADVGVGHARVLRLAAGVAAGEVGVAEDAGASRARTSSPPSRRSGWSSRTPSTARAGRPSSSRTRSGTARRRGRRP